MALTRPTAYQINTVSTTITDPLTVLNQGSTAANIDIGFILNRSPSANVAIVWQASSNQFIFANTSSSGTTNANITVSSYANLRTGNLITTSVTYANGQSILTNVESAITTANTNLKGYVDGQISTTTTAITTANTNLKGYTDNLVTTANTNLKGYTDGQISTTTTAITTANTNLKGYTDNLVTTANTNLNGYVDAANTIQSNQVAGANSAITTANTNMKGYVDGQISTTTTAITTANTNLKGYVDGQITNLVNGSPATLDTLNELAAALGNDANLSVTLTTKITNVQGNVTAANAAIVTANTNMKGYVDGQISTTTTAITTANTNLKGYTDNLVTTANTNLKGYVDGQISTTSTAITTANTNLKGYVDAANTVQSGQITTVSSSVTGANAAIVTANTNLKGYTDGQISTTTTAITTANTNLKGYTDNLVTTANTNLKGYTDGQISTTTTAITTANTNLKGYVDAANTIQSGQITTVSSSVTGANAAIVTANTNMKGYVDSIDSTKANLSGAVFTGNITVTELSVTSPGGDEGGQINLAKAVTNTTLVTGVNIDVYQNKLRIWESGGTNRGGYFDISGLSASVGTNLAAGGGGSPGGADTQVQFNNSSAFGGALSLHYFSGNGVVLANATVASTSTTTGALQVSGGIGVAGNVWCGQVYSTNNGNGTNYRIGDDAWLGDVNLADTTRLMGVQNGNNGYLQFGNVGIETLGRAGSGALTWTGTFSATNINSDNHNYANGTSIITTLSNTITTANTNMKGYVDAANTIQSGQITTVSSSVTGANAAIVTANTNMKGYVDNSVSSLSSNKISASGSNVTVTASFVNVAINSTNVASFSSTGMSTPYAITSTLATGTAPFTIASTTAVTNLNADLWDGNHFADYLDQAVKTTSSPTHAGLTVPSITHSGTTGVGNIGATGAAFNTVFAKSTSAQYADLAEIYTSDKKYVPGTVISFGGTKEVTISTASHDPTVAGVISTNPAYLMNDTVDGVAVALQGRVPCRVIGPISKGDRIVSSDRSGIAQRLDPAYYQPGCIIGKALDEVSVGQLTTIEVVVGRV